MLFDQLIRQIEINVINFARLILGYETNKQIVLQGSGSGGPAELAHSLQNDAVNYGYLRVSFKDDETSRTKFVLFTWKGDNAPVMRKGKTY